MDGPNFNAPVRNWGIEPQLGGVVLATKMPPKSLCVSQHKDAPMFLYDFWILQFGPSTFNQNYNLILCNLNFNPLYVNSKKMGKRHCNFVASKKDYILYMYI